MVYTIPFFSLCVFLIITVFQNITVMLFPLSIFSFPIFVPYLSYILLRKSGDIGRRLGPCPCPVRTVPCFLNNKFNAKCILNMRNPPICWFLGPRYGPGKCVSGHVEAWAVSHPIVVRRSPRRSKSLECPMDRPCTKKKSETGATYLHQRAEHVKFRHNTQTP